MGKVLKWLAILIACIGCIFFLGEKWGQHMAVRSFVYLDQLYPTKNLEDLFEAFPKGFSILHVKTYYENKTTMQVSVYIKGEPQTRLITGDVELEADVNGKRQSLEKFNITYQGGTSFNIPTDKKASSYLKNFQLLLAGFSYRNADLTSKKLVRVYDNPSYGRYYKEYLLNELGPIEGQDELDLEKYHYSIEFGRELAPFNLRFRSDLGIDMPTPWPQSKTLVSVREVISGDEFKVTEK